MVKKLFALASVTALTGLVSAVTAAGCTTTEIVSGGSDAGAVPDSSTSTKKDGGSKVDEEEEEEEDLGCLLQEPFDHTKIPYEKATHQPGACSSGEIKALKDFLDAKIAADDFEFSNDMKVWGDVVSSGCSECVFSNEEQESWGPILTTTNKEDKQSFAGYNWGSCFEIQSKETECGRAILQLQECSRYACLVDCKTQEEFDACTDRDENYEPGGPCEGSVVALDKACGQNLGAYDQACKGGLPTWINAACGGSADAPDAGADAGDDAGDDN